ncbi:hypothetical protein [Catalinimonas alkaloidigena]|uniref:hypothetical protein n=1 Tax=Catalinimonas alkaloidigena TaxID=1075417 RepID=UPI000B7E9036|nr:hypothetical protein [Catalinimonas alkaloidigena]
MGYDLHITRKSNWFDEESSRDISLTDWISYVTKDDEMRLDHFAGAVTDDGQKIRIEDEGLSVWAKYSKNGINGNFAWFTYANGQIVVKNPDKEIINKMIDIASVLGAKVQGDDGELYEIKEFINKEMQPWWKFWK